MGQSSVQKHEAKQNYIRGQDGDIDAHFRFIGCILAEALPLDSSVFTLHLDSETVQFSRLDARHEMIELANKKNYAPAQSFLGDGYLYAKYGLPFSQERSDYYFDQAIKQEHVGAALGKADVIIRDHWYEGFSPGRAVHLLEPFMKKVGIMNLIQKSRYFLLLGHGYKGQNKFGIAKESYQRSQAAFRRRGKGEMVDKLGVLIEGLESELQYQGGFFRTKHGPGKPLDGTVLHNKSKEL